MISDDSTLESYVYTGYIHCTILVWTTRCSLSTPPPPHKALRPLIPTHTPSPAHTQTEDARIVFRYNTDSLIGNEMPDMSNLLLVIPATNGVDNNLSNNGRTLTFQPTARANLAVTM